MERRGQVVDKLGRVWTGVVVHADEAEAEDFNFWFEGLSAEERVEAVDEALISSLKARGRHGVERLRRVSRVIKRKRG